MPPLSKTEELIAWIVGQIESGELRPGDPIPSARDLRTTRLDNSERRSITTVRIAVDRLKERGVLEGKTGVRVFVTDDALSVLGMPEP